MPKFVATSKDRYRATAAERRIHGGFTVTDFFVQMEGDPEKRVIVVRGYGPTPGERKTYAIREAERQFQAMERKANPSPLWRLNFQRSGEQKPVNLTSLLTGEEELKAYMWSSLPYDAWIIVASSQQQALNILLAGLTKPEDIRVMKQLPMSTFGTVDDAVESAINANVGVVSLHTPTGCSYFYRFKNYEQQETGCWDTRGY